jgi:hypothetical protein
VALRAFFGQYPLDHSTEPIEGWRAWRLRRNDAGAIRIAPTTPRPDWEPGVIGTVAMWGRVIEHTKGWRAEFAYPARLRLICVWCLWSGRLPGLPDHVLDRGGDLLPVCEEHLREPRAVGTQLEVRPVEGEMLDTYGVELLPVELLSPRA